MTLPTASQVSEVIGALYTLVSFVAFVAPKTSKIGLLAARFAADLKQAHTPAGKP